MEYRDASELGAEICETTPHYVKRPLAEVVAQASAPVVVLEGAHGVGKTALVKNEPAFQGFHYVSLADEETFAQASRGLSAWVASLPRPVVIDEAHRVEGLLKAAREASPRNRGGHPIFVLLSPVKLRSENAPGLKPDKFMLFPLTRAEMDERPGCIIDDLFDGNIAGRYCSLSTRSDLRASMHIGGFPYAVLHPVRALSQESEAKLPFWDDLRLLDDEEVGPTTSLERLIDRAILREVLTNPGISLGVDALACACYIDADTLTTHLEAFCDRFLLHRLLMLDRSESRSHSFAKTRLHPMDVSIAIEALGRTGQDIAGGPAAFSKVLRTLCIGQLVPAAQWASEPTACRHWRKFDRRMREVDLVLVRDDRLVGITVRNSLAARSDTIGALRFLAEDTRFARGFIIYMGKFPRQLTENIWALPVSALWESSAFRADRPEDEASQ